MRFMSLTGTSPAVLAVALAVGCGGESRTVAIDGSSTVFRISKAAQIGFHRDVPSDIQVLLNNSGTGGGFGKYLQGEIDIVNASRPARAKEEAQAVQNGYDWTRFVVGYDGVTVAVNPENDFCTSLTVEQLREIFRPGSPIQNWNQIDPSYPDLKIIFYTPDNDSGTYDFFVEAILHEEGAQRKDVQASSDDNTLVTGVSGDRGALGYFGYAYYAANAARLKALAIQNGPDAEPVAPSIESILEDRYQPLSRPLLLYASNASMRRPEVAEFLRYYITNNDALARRAGYVPPMASDQQENLAKLPAAAAAATEAPVVATGRADAPRGQVSE